MLIDQPAIERNAADIDGNTCLHLASSQGQTDVIRFLVSEASVDHMIKNSANFLAYDIAYNKEVQMLLTQLAGEHGNEENKNQYGRRAFDGVLQHNDRVTKITGLMHKFGQLEKQIKHQHASEEQLVERLE